MERVKLPLLPAIVQNLRAGQAVLLEGELYVARDAAHARLVHLIQQGKPLPFDLRGAVIYYMGPTPTPPGAVIGSCGPTGFPHGQVCSTLLGMG
jgi:fumarate hydratase subunit beta